MTEDLEEVAKLLGAEIVGQVPDVGRGVLGAARLAKIYQARTQEICRRLQESPTDPAPAQLLTVPVHPVAASVAGR
jgi:hypothetical protein